jgi:hypothetical protein
MAKNNETQTPPSPPLFSVAEICENSEMLFGKKRDVVIGALNAETEKGKTQFSVEETRAAIEKYLKMEVKTNGTR